MMNDYNVIKSHFGTNVAGRALGDLTGDGVVNLLDFAQWKKRIPVLVPVASAAARCLSRLVWFWSPSGCQSSVA